MAKVVRYTRKPDRPVKEISTFQTRKDRGVLKELKHHIFNNTTRWTGALTDGWRFADVDPTKAGRCEWWRTWDTVRQAQHDLFRVAGLDCRACPVKGTSCPRFGERWNDSETRKLMLELDNPVVVKQTIIQG